MGFNMLDGTSFVGFIAEKGGLADGAGDDGRDPGRGIFCPPKDTRSTLIWLTSV